MRRAFPLPRSTTLSGMCLWALSGDPLFFPPKPRAAACSRTLCVYANSRARVAKYELHLCAPQQRRANNDFSSMEFIVDARTRYTFYYYLFFPSLFTRASYMAAISRVFLSAGCLLKIIHSICFIAAVKIHI